MQLKVRCGHTLAGVCLILIGGVAHAVDTVVFSSSGAENKPLSMTTAAVLNEAFRRNGISFEVEYSPSSRSLEMSNTGRLDGELHRVAEFTARTKGKFKNLHRIDSKLISARVSAFAKADLDISTWEDIVDAENKYNVVLRIGRKRTTNILVNAFEKARGDHRKKLDSEGKLTESEILAELDEVTMESRVRRVKDEIQGMRMVSSGRADVIIIGETEGWQFVNTNPDLSELNQLAVLDLVDIHAYMHSKHKALIPLISRTIDEMKKDGSYKSIVDAVAGVPLKSALIDPSRD